MLPLTRSRYAAEAPSCGLPDSSWLEGPEYLLCLL